jgi:site-specific DNA-methyltransferase (adenine-specific)
MSDGKKEILLGDCLELMKDIPNGSIDMILCDLPYGTTACKWDTIIPFDKLWEQYERIIKPNGAIVLTAKQPFTSKLVCSKIDWLRESLVWIKHKPTNFANGKYMHLNYTEDILVFGKGKPTYNPQMQPRKSERVKQVQNGSSKNWRSKPKTENEVAFSTDYEPREWTVYNADMKLPMNYIELPSVVSNSKEKQDHPTQKTVALFEYLIKTYSNENDLILDNCAGSGTTAESCLNTNRQFIVMEKEQKYYDMILKRVGDFNKKFETQTLFGNEM